MPPMTRAEIHGPLAELETLIDEYYVATGVDRRRRDYLQREIVALAERHGLDRDLGLARDDTDALRALDAHLCELKEMQIRDGLHVLGTSPQGHHRTDTLVAIARAQRSGATAAAIVVALALLRTTWRSDSIRSIAIRPPRGMVPVPLRCATFPMRHGGAPATPSSASSCWRRAWCYAPKHRISESAHAPCSTGYMPCSRCPSTHPVRPRSPRCSPRSTENSWRPGLPGRRPAGGRTCCLRGGTSIR